ncbi:MAG: type II toxin-antitoxin system VapC family toxin [Chloroflexi bacterium]|nr:type II toxin-antitoxin system VapC family toxin [Chloroflexota bacterium]
MAEIVVDASVLAALAFQEERAEAARALLDGAVLYAPTLVTYELVSVARDKILRNSASGQDIREQLMEALAMDFQWVEVSYGEVLELALARRLSTYDACYLYLASSRGIPLVTFDTRLEAASRA